MWTWTLVRFVHLAAAAVWLGMQVTLAVLGHFIPTWAALLAAVGAAYAPYSYIVHRRDKRFHKFRENFPDVLDSLARALRAGYPLSAAMEMIAAETAPPVSVEMRRT